jgi:hypothetical protein
MKHDPQGSRRDQTWKVMGRASDPGQSLTWLALEPVTGRTHQLAGALRRNGLAGRRRRIFMATRPASAGRRCICTREIVVPLYKNKRAGPRGGAGAGTYARAADSVRMAGEDANRSFRMTAAETRLRSTPLSKSFL